MNAHHAVVGLIDYQAGNIQSLENAFFHIGARVIRIRSESQLKPCTHLVLPGVGAFGFCAEKLQQSGLIEPLEQWTLMEQRPLLGICVGMQLLGDHSEESPTVPGLGWLGGEINRLPLTPGIRIPHVGWNTVRFSASFASFAAGEEADFYFDHSYAHHHLRAGKVLGRCQHGSSFNAILQCDNIVATQCHPEKSQEVGLRFLRGFIAQ